jgi:hypothetical protein
MGRIKACVAVEAALAAALVLLMLLPACRREQEPLDRNKAPNTYLTSAPTETTATDYRVHMFWHGTDDDGTVERYIWYISDTLLTLDPDRNPDAEQRDWNPAARIADYLRGRFTTQTDTVMIFKGFDDRKLAQINRQAFHIAAIDDGGRIDPSPARIQFLARVRGVPTVKFWLNFGAGDKAYTPSALDTISMFAPFTIKFIATTVNNVITGYRWSYGGKVYPDYNNDGNPEWLIPERQDQVISVELPNTGADVLPSGAFNFKVIARDEAGALSKSDIITGEGVCRVVINHDPDTEILYGDCFYTPQSGVPESLTVYFDGAVRDTLPYDSRLRMRYRGWDDAKDDLEFTNPPLPIRFQFQYNRWAYNEEGARVTEKVSPWYPLKVPEDTNPNADVEDTGRDIDSTTMRVGSFDYRFLARSYDEQGRPDGTPAVVPFVGNFPPSIDSMKTGFYDQRTPTLFRPAVNDTLRISWLGPVRGSSGDLICPYDVKVVVGATITKYFKYVIVAGGHDDRRDPVGSGVKAWRYRIFDPDQDYPYYREGEWQFNRPLNLLEQEVSFSITVPFVTDTAGIRRQADSLLANPPAFLGMQGLEVTGRDVKDTETFKEGIRGISPKFDEFGNVIPANNWITNDYFLSNYARGATRTRAVYLKLVR